MPDEWTRRLWGKLFEVTSNEEAHDIIQAARLELRGEWERVVRKEIDIAAKTKDNARGRQGGEGWIAHGQGAQEACERILIAMGIKP